MMAEEQTEYDAGASPADMPKDELTRMVKELESAMKAGGEGTSSSKKPPRCATRWWSCAGNWWAATRRSWKRLRRWPGAGPVRYGRSQAGGRDRSRRYRR